VFIVPTPTGAPLPPAWMASKILLSFVALPVAQGEATGPHCPLSAPFHQPPSTVLSPNT
jgi:hypothetical protein